MEHNDTQPSFPIALRTLKWHGHEGSRAITISIGTPTPSEDHFACHVTIDGLPEPFRTTTLGIDSLQAIILAVVSAREQLAAHADNISFLDQPRQHGIPFIVPPFDPEEDRYIEQLVWGELNHFLELSGLDQTRQASQLAESYGLRPISALHEVKTEVLIEMLSEASGLSNSAEHDSTRAYAFEERRRAIKGELKKRGAPLLA